MESLTIQINAVTVGVLLLIVLLALYWFLNGVLQHKLDTAIKDGKTGGDVALLASFYVAVQLVPAACAPIAILAISREVPAVIELIVDLQNIVPGQLLLITCIVGLAIYIRIVALCKKHVGEMFKLIFLRE